MLEALNHYLETLILDYIYRRHSYKIMAILQTFAKPSSNNVLQPSLIRGSGCNTLLHSGLANVDTHKIIIYLLIDTVRVYYAPNFEKVGSILVSACAFVRPVRPSVRPVKTTGASPVL